MHGRVKTKTSAENQEAKRKEREKKSKLYKIGIEKAFKKRQAGEYDEEALAISAQLLIANPDITTLWNIRREVLLHFKDEDQRSEGEIQQQMQGELRLTEQCLCANPKSYGGWYHRRWVLDNMPIPIWEQELALCNKYLELDERNFHCWDFRRFVVERSQICAADEFEYSSKKIMTNFSNYSSWHYRSCLLPLIYPDPTGKLPIQENKHKEGNKKPTIVVSLLSGTSLVHCMSLNAGKREATIKPQFSAGFSEGITSVLQDELDSCMQLLDLEPDSKWTLLTCVLLMQAIDRHRYQEDTFTKLNQLTEVDCHRSGYYRDLWSRYKMEYTIDKCSELDQNIDFSCLNLTALYNCHYLSCVHTVDLSNNNLSSRSLPQLHPLQCCQVLKLESNAITSLHGMPTLKSLEILSLRGNIIKTAEEVKFLQRCTNLSSVDLRDNPTEKDEMLKELVQTFLLSVNMLNGCSL